jgi:hypothetical protein
MPRPYRVRYSACILSGPIFRVTEAAECNERIQNHRSGPSAR